MSRSVTYLVLAALGLIGISAYGEMRGVSGPPGVLRAGLASGSGSGASFSAPEVAPPVPPDSVTAMLERGRPWHASRILEREREIRGGLPPADLLLLARAHAGWRNWEGVREVLDGPDRLDRTGGGAGWWLLARADEELGSPEEAAVSYLRYVEASPGRDTLALRARVRRARMLARADRWEEAGEEIDRVAASAPALAEWTALAAAQLAASRGTAAEVDRLVGRLTGERAARGWDLPSRALLAAGDTAAAAATLEAALGTAPTDAERAGGWATLGELRLSAGDRGSAAEAFRASLAAEARGGPAVRSSRALLELGETDPERLLAMARALDAADADEAALEAYDRHVEALEVAAPDVRLARARLMARAGGRADEAVEELRELSAADADPGISAPALAEWAALRRRQGRDADRRTLQERLVERFPSSGEAVTIVFFRADAAHDRGDRAAALAGYRRAMEMAPSLDRAGLSRMRAGQMLLHAGDHEGAAGVFESYLERYPEGRRWQQATYWGAVANREAGRVERADSLLHELRRRDPLDYYSLLAARALGEPFRLDVAERPATTPAPPWMEEGLALLDHLAGAGLPEGAEAVEADLRRRAGSSDDRLTLAEAFHRRGRSIAALNLGWEVRREGRDWDRRLLEVIYPLPYAAPLAAEAREWGVDPWLMAAIARRESAWVEDITSAAGARGLMQVMPETGRALARRVGPEDFHPRNLWTAEISLHLGGAFLRDVLARYDGVMPLVLSAYNAGPSRANAWRSFPESSDLVRFVERIPFSETREYVRQITRNREVYAWLYPELEDRARTPGTEEAEPSGTVPADE